MTANIDSRWTKTYLDRLGRTARQERGDTAVTKSVVETVYDTCGCNPLGVRGTTVQTQCASHQTQKAAIAQARFFSNHR